MDKRIFRTEFSDGAAASKALSSDAFQVEVCSTRKGPFNLTMEGSHLPRLFVVRSETTSGVNFSTSAHLDGYAFSVLQSGQVQVGNNHLIKGRPLAIDLRLSSGTQFAQGTCYDAMIIKTADMISAYEEFTQGSWTDRRLASISMDACLEPMLARLFDAVHIGNRSGLLNNNGLATRSLEDALLRLVLYSKDGISPKHISRREVRRAVDYMESNAHLPITVTDVAREIGVGLRSLQVAFGREMSMTPYAFLRRRRLIGARRELVSGEVTSVSEAARRWGFTSVSHFGRVYADLFGELPSQTLAGR